MTRNHRSRSRRSLAFGFSAVALGALWTGAALAQTEWGGEPEMPPPGAAQQQAPAPDTGIMGAPEPAPAPDAGVTGAPQPAPAPDAAAQQPAPSWPDSPDTAGQPAPGQADPGVATQPPQPMDQPGMETQQGMEPQPGMETQPGMAGEAMPGEEGMTAGAPAEAFQTEQEVQAYLGGMSAGEFAEMERRCDAALSEMPEQGIVAFCNQVAQVSTMPR